MTHHRLLSHLAYHTAHIVAIGAIASREAVTQLTRYTVLRAEHTGNGATEQIIIGGVDGDISDTQVVDGSRYLSEEAYGCSVLADIDLGITDDMSATVVVAIEGIGLANGCPVLTPVVLLQNILHIDVALLLEIEVPRVGATVHIVGQGNQVVFFDDVGITLGSTTLFENILIVFPLYIELLGRATYLHRLVDFYPCAFTVFLGIPL